MRKGQNASANEPRSHFFVELVGDGAWAVGVGSTRLATFPTRACAIDDVKKRRAQMTESGRRSTLIFRSGAYKPSDES
jgi:hypothetical protein